MFTYMDRHDIYDYNDNSVLDKKLSKLWRKFNELERYPSVKLG